MKNQILLIITILKWKLLDIEKRLDRDEDYDYNSGLEDGLMVAIKLLNKIV